MRKKREKREKREKSSSKPSSQSHRKIRNFNLDNNKDFMKTYTNWQTANPSKNNSLIGGDSMKTGNITLK